jgi:ABC transporter, phosphonate, periplasmic substrate-binding protein
MSRLLPTLALSLLALPAWAGSKDFVVYAPGFGGSPQQAKPYLETFFREIEKALAWPAKSADGQFFDELKPAEEYIEKQKPGFGVLSPALYLDLACGKSQPDLVAAIIGVTNVPSSGKYHVVVKANTAKSLDDLKGKKLASNHLQNMRFVSRVVFAGKIDAEKHFVLEATNSPIRPFKAVDRGEADAALVDDAQLEHMKTLPFGQTLSVVYSSDPLPPFPVVAFGKVVKPAEREAMKKALLQMCGGAGGPVCKSLQIIKFDSIDPAAFKPAVQKYCK